MDTTRDKTTGIRTRKLDELGTQVVELSGEFDVHDLETLRRVLDEVSSSGLPVHVDLFGVTFLDLRCTRELMVRSRLFEHRPFCDPSWQAEASIGSCRLDRIGSYPGREHQFLTEARKHAEREPCGTLALVV